MGRKERYSLRENGLMLRINKEEAQGSFSTEKTEGQKQPRKRGEILNIRRSISKGNKGQNPELWPKELQ